MPTMFRSFANVVRPVAIASLLAIAASPACASEPMPRPAALDPSNPEAPESPRTAAPLIAATTTPAPAPSAPPAGAKDEKPAIPPAAPAGAKDEKPAATTYTCPMHPEVVSDKPGRCPKCGMKLVPREPAAPGGKQ